ncbi:hypothetical protein [Rhodopirellula sp. P2]|uniref:hypothetical protein n=1 Tax=Rhodopirellula sp. P2 TaxID=2127060 RepID=UPI002367DC82|nr:hypothetical protein [Rhodopirellula sp. P2]WDQ17473.1 hypothetical protein PSR62_02710 [Rhodopirellula sp. P2]
MFDRQVFFRQLPHRLSIRSITIGLSVAFGITLGMPSSLPAENWTSLTGNRTIQAQMVGLWNDNVILLMSSGQRVSVPMKSLIAESRIQAEEIAARLKEQRQSLSEELRQVADAESAAAPDPLPTPPAPPAYQPLAPNLPIDETIEQIQSQIREGHLAVVVDALPPSFRSELDQLVDLAMQKIDANEWNEGNQRLYRLVDLIVTRQNWIQSHPRLASGDPSSPSAFNEAFVELILPTANALRSGLAGDAMMPDNIRQKGFTNWVRDRSESVAPYFRQLTQAFASSDPQWEVASFKEDTATIQRAGPGNQQPGQRRPNRGPTHEMVRVEGYWIPKTLADHFPKWIEEQTQKLEAMTDGGTSMADLAQNSGGMNPMASSTIQQSTQMFETFLQPLESAADATAFHEASEQMIATVQPMISMFSAMANMGGGRNQNGMSGYGNSGYGSGEPGYDDMNMGMEPGYGDPMMEDGSMDQSGPSYGMEPMNQ